MDIQADFDSRFKPVAPRPTELMRMTPSPGGRHFVRGVLDPATCERWLQEVRGVLHALAGHDVGQPRPWASGFLLDDHLPHIQTHLQRHLGHHPAIAALLHQQLGPRPHLLHRHGWVRHQRPPQNRLPGQEPHSWHQDGALAFDFLRHRPPYPGNALLPMLTCWIPLVDCGEALAPSLAWFEPSLSELLPPQDLAEERIDAVMHTHYPDARCRVAELSAGDALLFDGGTVHRTHAHHGMPQDRLSLELRWLPEAALPERLARLR